MPRLKRKAKKRRNRLTDGHLFDLAVGPFFPDGGYEQNHDAMRAAWQDPQVRELVWSYWQRRVEEHGKTGADAPWASREFGDGQ
jgi:hypothetical protein